MNAEKSLQLARRFIELPLEKRRLFLEGLNREGIDFAQFPIPAGVEAADRQALSYAQQRMWFLWQLDPHSGAYNLPGAVRLEGPLDIDALQACFEQLVGRHEALRTVFQRDADDNLSQVPLDEALVIARSDLSAYPPQAREAQVRQAALEESLRPFDLARGPLLRLRLLTLGPTSHVLLLTLHHIVSDGWSMNVLIDEFSRCYDAFAQGQVPVLAPLPIQYADYALWQRRWLEAGEQARQLAYWQQVLGEEHPVMELPGDRPRPSVPSQAGERFDFALDAGLAERARAFAREHNVTLFMVLLGAFDLLLQRYTGLGELRVGSPVANRNRSETEGLIGLFVNTQVLCTRVDPTLDGHALLAAVRETVLGAQAHQDLPFERLVDALKVERSLTHSPLFQVMYNHQPQVADVQAIELAAGLRLDVLDWRSRTTQFDLSLDTYEKAGVLHAAFTFASDLFDAATVQRMARHWQNLLRQWLAAPQLPVGQLQMLDAEEHQRQLQQWNDSHRHYPQDLGVHQLFEARVREMPGAPALVFADTALDYAELNARANRLAHHLIALGAGPEVLVGIAVQRSVEMVVGLMAILKAGAAYVPLDPEYPQERLRYMIEDSGIGLLLTQQALLEQLPVPGGLVCLALDGLDLSASPAHDPQRPLAPESLAYVIYTSGSTGQPKGAGNRHLALTNRLCWMQEAYALQPGDTVLQKTPFSFDVSVWEFFWPLMVGARLAVAAPGAHRDPEQLIGCIRRWQVSTLHFVPSMLQAFIHAPGVQACDSLRRIVCSGEALPLDAQQQVFARLPQARLYNLYGPTEAAIDVTHWTCVEEGRDSVPIGVPIANLRTFVLDSALMPVPAGVSGELYLQGAGLARGYHQRPGLSAERFVACPFIDGARMYRTGDRVRQRDNGVIEYLGRFDHQVKLRGLRIELGEIEARLAQHASVREAVVLVLEDKHLVAWLVPEDAAPTVGWEEALKAWVGQALPEYMVPSHLLALACLPVTANGKLDRKALPLPVFAASARYSAPQTATQKTLAQIWQAVLGVAQVGLDDNYFELGGDSIVSIQVVGRARQAGLALAPRDLFQHQTLRSLAQVARACSQAVVDQGPVTGEVLPTPVQQMFFEQALATPNHWNQALLLKPRERLQAAPLQAALAALVAHHDALRLRFEHGLDGWRQQHAGLEALPQLWQRQAADGQALRAVCDEAQRSLDLAQGPLLRGVLVEMADGSQRLLLVIHHLVVDGVSWRVLLEDLQGLCRPQPQALPAKTTSYQAWALRLHGYREQAQAQLPHWLAQLAQADDLPGANRDVALRNRDEDKVHMVLDQAWTQRLLQQAPAAYRTQINDLLLAALARAVCRWTGRDDTLVQLEGHGREELFEQVDLSRTLGWFTSLYPVRLAPQAGLGESIKAIKEQLRAVPDRGLGYGVLRYMGGPQVRAQLAACPGVPRITFNYLGRFDGQFDERALFTPAAEGPGAGQAEDAPLANWLTVEGQVHEGRLQLAFGFSRAMFDGALIQALADDMREQLQQLVEHCVQQPCSQPTWSDFPLAGLAPAQFDSLAAQLGDIDDLYPLTPMQQGMLFHALYADDAGAYINQLRVDVQDLDVERFRQAWQATVQAHDILRSRFFWEGGLERPLQGVCRQVRLELQVHEGRQQPDLPAHLDALAQARRQAGFALERAPLFNLDLVRCGEQQHHLIYTHHHILMDGWSNARLLGEVLARYQGQAPARPASRYRDYIERLQQLPVQAAEAFWREQLQGLQEPFRLAALLPADGVAGQGRGTLGQHFDAERTAALAACARQHKVTLNTLVQAAWLLLLHRYSGRDEVVVGATVSGRGLELPGIEEQIGLFINTLPVVARPRAEQPLGEWLQQVQALNLALREHEQTPLFELQRWAGVQGEGLFDHILVFENYPLAEALQQARGPRFGTPSNLEQTHYPLAVAVTLGQTLDLQYDFDRAAIGAAALERLAGHFDNLLQALQGDARIAIGNLPMLAAQEQQRLLATASGAPLAAVEASGIHQLLRAQVARTPQACALEWRGERLSYQALELRANRLALRLQAAGAGPEQVVAISAERSLETFIALLAVLKTGAAYLPLDPSYPSQRLAFMLEDSGARLLLCPPGLALPVPAGVQVLALQPDHDDAPAPLVEVRPAADSLAYVIYTSGSTGRPKGVQVRHGGLLNHMRWMLRAIALTPEDRVLQKTSLSFDASVWECWLPLLAGAQLVLAEPALSRDMSGLWACVAQLRISVLQAVPSLLQALLGEADAARLASLRYLMVGGEALSASLVNTLLQRWPGRVVNLYGPTEATIQITWAQFEASVAGAMAPIGRPVDQVQVQVLGSDLQLQPEGVVGELCIGGASLARGYHARPGLTAERFVPDPHAQLPGARLYRTGDLGRQGPDGLVYAGRADQQVKVRGFRIEPGEVEQRLLALAPVREAAVLALDGRLEAFVVAPTASAQGLLDDLRQALPEHMVPGRLQLLERLPMMPNGKLDRTALKQLAGEQAQRPHRAPQSALQRQVGAVWEQVLGCGPVGLDDSFFALGGHSLLATQVVSRLRQELGLQLALRALFDSPSLEAFVATLGGLARAGQVPALQAVDQHRAQPLSFAQQRLWFLWQLEPHSSMYNIPRALELVGELQVDAVREAFAALLQRHTVLRTRFFEEQGQAWQQVDGQARLPFTLTDLSELAPAARQVALAEHMQESASAPFDLRSGPLLRVQLLRLEARRHVLLVTLHHVVADHWSFAILIREFAALYQALAKGQAHPLPAAGLQYLDFAVWQRQWLEGGEMQRQLGYWREQLGGEHFISALPRSASGPQGAGQGCAVHEYRFDEALSQGLRSLAQRQGLTLYMLLLAGFALVVSLRCGQSRVRLGSDIANRNHTGVEEMVGFFVNQLVLQLTVDEQQSIAGFLAHCRDVVIAASDHQDLPFDRLVEALRLPRRAGRSPLFEIKFIYQEQGASLPAIDGLQVQGWPAGQAAAELEMIAEFVNGPQAIEVGFKCMAGLYEASDIDALFAQLVAVFERLLDSPQGTLAPLLQLARERQREAQQAQLQARSAQLQQQHPIRRRASARNASEGTK
ncbi:non-ribosomal peptide synthetase [Pseudomonas muyukensis]|uniref:Amino acid adenylation domain-containing protein n=1 Tax=Pseudomonas muyukensis TaxID=2842357 RepID=A0ABX8M6D5_9PSED|nr:non-ribosomal peptide synthetase [Pseudomonas muyukensis]QXH33941.1 amino acid adenylation domain-containing protein [Pseudomonas muyukensis]